MTRHPSSPKSLATNVLPLPIPPAIPMMGLPSNTACPLYHRRWTTEGANPETPRDDHLTKRAADLSSQAAKVPPPRRSFRPAKRAAQILFALRPPLRQP